MNCRKCGQILPTGAGICAFCGTETDNYNEIMNENINRFGMQKCELCGYVGNAVPEKMLQKKDWVILILTFSSGIWIFYLAYIYFKKGDASKRNLVCPSCGKVMKYYIDDNTLQNIFNNDEKTNQIKNGVKEVVTNPELKKNFKELKNSIRDLHDTL